MKILHIRLVNFSSIKAAMGLNCLELDFSDIDKPIIQLYARNRCGKSVLLSNLNPFSSINYDGDERNDLPSILRGEPGEKNIVYEINGKIYNITHTYKPNAKSHSILSSILEDGIELNPSGGVNNFNLLIEKIFGLNKYIFQFIINSTQLTSFAKCSATQRKNRLNKSLGIDIYDKIHKLSTDDYRYTNKMIQSLNATKEFLVSAYGTYENLYTSLINTRNEYNSITNEINELKSNLDKLNGMISSLRGQNISIELSEVNRQIQMYQDVVESVGEFNGLEYDRIVNEQIQINGEINELKAQRLLKLKDVDVLYSKKQDIVDAVRNNERATSDYQNMVNLVESLKERIKRIEISVNTSASSERYRSLLSHAQTINSICKEIVTTLNKNHLELFSEMISKGIDISIYLAKESNEIMDAEKEKVIISRIYQLMHTSDGVYPSNNCTENCIYKNAYELIDTYFKSMESETSEKMTAYDITNMEHAYKNIQTIRRLLNIEVPDELVSEFHITHLMNNLNEGKFGIDTNLITLLMEEAAKVELRNQLIKQLADSEVSLESMRSIISNVSDQSSSIQDIELSIQHIQSECDEIQSQIDDKIRQSNDIDSKRMRLSSIQNINIKELYKQQSKLNKLNEEMNSHNALYQEYYTRYNSLLSQQEFMKRNLEKLENDNNQFISTEHAISEQVTNNELYKIISDSTSSTKGKPVEEIRSKVESALSLTNRLLNVMYDSELEMLKPTINENEFSLPFRIGTNVNTDVRYGSQSEQALLSLALSMSLASFLSHYNIFLIDEIDAYLDATVADSFIMMISEIMAICKIEQIFLISHHVTEDRCPQYVYELNLMQEIERQRDNYDSE